MSSSSSSPPFSLSANTSSLAGCLHGGNNRNNNYYDLTTDNSDGDDHATAASVVAVRGSNRSSSSVAGRRRISATMDDGRTQQQHRYGNSSGDFGPSLPPVMTQHQATTGSSTHLSRSSAESRHRSVVSIIDLVNDSDDEVEFAGTKRSLPLPPPERNDVVDEYGHASSSSSHYYSVQDDIVNKKRIRISSSSSSTLVEDNHSIHHHMLQQQKTPTTTTTHSYYLNLPSRKCPRDGATITFGLPSLINLLEEEDDTHNTRTCEGSVESSRFKLKKLSPISSSSSSSSSSQDQNLLLLPYYYYNHQPFHYLQHDNWSCGYRNLQMLLSSMMPTLLLLQSQSTSSPSSFYTTTTTATTTGAVAAATASSSFSRGSVPCIEEIQRTMELLWSQGYDIRNAEHHKYALVGKKTWIGAVEVWSYLSFMRVDSIIVQFIKTSQNRALLGRFVWAYFDRVCPPPFGCSSCQDGGGGVREHWSVSMDRGGGSVGRSSGAGGSDSGAADLPPLASPMLTSLEYADHLLREITKSNNTVDNDKEQQQRGHQQQQCQCSIPPLYLQWEGHSVTVVGIKRLRGHRSLSSSSTTTTTTSPDSYSLIIFCPQKNVANVKNAFVKEFHSRYKHATTEDDDYYLTNTQKKFGSSNNNSILELPATKLLQKDCQILLTTGKRIDEMESKRRTVCSNEVGFLNAIAR